jgi:hypothetical protein
MIYKVICSTVSVSEALVQARSKKEAVRIAQDNSVFSEAKEEVVGAEYETEEIGDHPKGHIVFTKTGYIDADKKRHKI